MYWIYRFRNWLSPAWIKTAIIMVVILIILESLTMVTARADDFFEQDLFTGTDPAAEEYQPFYEEIHGNDEPVRSGATDFHEDADSIANSQHNLKNSPHSIRNSEYNLNNSQYSHGNNIIRDNNGNATGYWVERDDGGVNIFGYGGKGRTGYIPAPRNR